MLFWRRIPRRTQQRGVLLLPLFEEAGNTKVDQIIIPLGGPHNVGRFKVAEDNGRLAGMQIVQDGAELHPNVEYLLNRQLSSPGFPQVFPECPAINEVHYEIPVSGFAKVVIAGGNIVMLAAREQVRFTFESLDCRGQLLRTQAALPHLLDGHEPVAKERISRLVDRSEAALPDLLKNSVALLEQVIPNKRSGSISGGRARS